MSMQCRISISLAQWYWKELLGYRPRRSPVLGQFSVGGRVPVGRPR